MIRKIISHIDLVDQMNIEHLQKLLTKFYDQDQIRCIAFLLKHGEFEDIHSFISNIAHIDTRNDLNSLYISFLKDNKHPHATNNVRIRCSVANGLAQLRMLDDLLDMAHDPEEEVRLSVVKGIKEMGATFELNIFVEDKSSRVQSIAWEGLIEDRSHKNLIFLMEKHSMDPALAGAAMKINVDDFVRHYSQLEDVHSKLLSYIRINGSLDSELIKVQEENIEMRNSIKDILFTYTKEHKDTLFRREAVRGLIKIRAIDELRSLKKDPGSKWSLPDYITRIEVARGFAELGENEELYSMIFDSDAKVFIAVINAFAQLEDLPMLKKILMPTTIDTIKQTLLINEDKNTVNRLIDRIPKIIKNITMKQSIRSINAKEIENIVPFMNNSYELLYHDISKHISMLLVEINKTNFE